MKRHISITFLMMLLAYTFVFAQGGGKGKGKIKSKPTPEEIAIAQEETNKMADVMGLDATQKDAVYAANLQAAQDMRPIREAIEAKYPTKDERKTNEAAIEEEFKPQMKPIKKALKEAIKAAVGEDKWQRWKDHR